MTISGARHSGYGLMLLALAPAIAVADESSAGAGSAAARSAAIGGQNLNSGYLVQLVIGLLFVLLCIVVLAWLAKRVNRFQATADGSLQVLGGLSMGARERVVLVQVGSTQLLLGVAPGRINMLHQLEQPLETVGPHSSDRAALPFGKSFADRLNTALARGK